MQDWNLRQYIQYLPEVKYLIPPAFLDYLGHFGWNSEIIGYGDVLAACKRNKITLLEHDMKLPGLYYFHEGKPYIVQSKSNKGIFRIYVCCHELVHYNLDLAHICCYADISGTELIECRAHVVASCSIIPAPMLEEFTNHQLESFFNYPRDLVQLRRAVSVTIGL
jgi:Zn-dependent peptidase ImmA (M78 family)